MKLRIRKYRRSSDLTEDPDVGCIVLVQPFFFDRRDWISAPLSFAKNIVRGKTYDFESLEGRALWRDLEARLLAVRQDEWQEVAALGAFAMVRRRLGQGAFRVLVTDTYRRQCAISGEKVLPVLQAAHIQPVASGGLHRIENGLLLRSDIHTLFDRGYVTVTPRYEVRVSNRLKKDFADGEYYGQFDGQGIWLPTAEQERPDAQLLEWHSDTVFRAS
ncbi:MAG: HNH endonuclease [Actinomycetota bacterium]